MERQLETLRDYELRLLRCTSSLQPPPLSTDHSLPPIPLHGHIDSLLSFIEAGDYLQALSSDAARIILDSPNSDDFTDSAESASTAYSDLMHRVESFINDSTDDSEKGARSLLVVCVAVAALLWFTQCNITGPLDDLPKCLNPIVVTREVDLIQWETWARNQLMSAGSDLLGKFSNLQYLVCAQMLLMRINDLLFEGSDSTMFGIRSISWWIVRVLFTHQKILDERSSHLFDMLHVFMGATLTHFGTLEKVTSYWGTKLIDEERATIVSMIHLEAGLLEDIYARVDSCREHFGLAEEAAGLQLYLSGAMGFRTVHQVDAKAQRVLVSQKSSSEGADTFPLGSQSHNSDLEEISEVYMAPKLLENSNGSGILNVDSTAFRLNGIQQAVVLAQCLLIEKNSRSDELQRWDMAPYIEAIDSQQSSCFILRCFCDILRVRWEKMRGRTKERALLKMEKLVEGVSKNSPPVAERIRFCYVVNMPTIPAFRKEYGQLLVSCGLIGEALTIFESLELWDILIHCNCLLGKKAAAVELIKSRLTEVPNDPRLWCSLGDVTLDDSCYEKAVEVSGDSSARAKRSLARSAYNRGEYEKSKNLWMSAMAMNSLYPDGWFALGSAALKARDMDKAVDGFSRAVQLDPDNGEAWNNIACLHMIRKKNDASFIAFKEALKFKRNSWQCWENYSHVALDVGNVSEALRAVKMVLDITKNKQVDTGLLEKIMLEVEQRTSTEQCSLSSATSTSDSTLNFTQESENADMIGRRRETEHLVDALGKVLKQIIGSGNSGGDIWGLYARWHKINGDLTMCSEALLKQVRSYQGSDLWKDKERFKKFTHASLELCKVYMEISSSTGSRRELFTAEMHLKNTLKQAECFSDMEEFRVLQTCHEEVKKLQSDSLPN
ncbi:hypothetical protein ACFE04_009935 [Oxalis oulophora]